ncbi:MAG: sterol desaturase family protein [Methylococcaceae bacterium]|nr:sterol desaturase family protein [Methylococcaceae bacterium]
MQINSVFEFLLAFLFAAFYATFVEYTMHRFMHAGFVASHQHAMHHQQNTGEGWLEEFRNYFVPTLSILWVGFLYSAEAGVGFAAGGALAAAWAAYAHQLQHERPELVFWLSRPIHHLHHKHKMLKHNFGISVEFWDHVFGTYRPGTWEPEKKPSQYPLHEFFRIQWY